jgi:hypothetical protein
LPLDSDFKTTMRFCVTGQASPRANGTTKRGGLDRGLTGYRLPKGTDRVRRKTGYSCINIHLCRIVCLRKFVDGGALCEVCFQHLDPPPMPFIINYLHRCQAAVHSFLTRSNRTRHTACVYLARCVMAQPLLNAAARNGCHTQPWARYGHLVCRTSHQHISHTR